MGFRNYGFTDRVTDKLGFTNKKERIDMENQLRFQQNMDLMRPSYQKAGMIAAGINPLAASGSLQGGAVASPSTGANNPSQGGTGGITDLLSTLLPIVIKAVK